MSRANLSFFLLISICLFSWLLLLACADEGSSESDGDEQTDGDAAPDGDESPDGDQSADGDQQPDGDQPSDGDETADGDEPSDGDQASDGDEMPDGDDSDGDDVDNDGIDGDMEMADGDTEPVDGDVDAENGEEEEESTDHDLPAQCSLNSAEYTPDISSDARFVDLDFDKTRLSAEDQRTLNEFVEAMNMFKDMESSEFLEEYGPAKNYSEGVDYDPNTAEHMDGISEFIQLSSEQQAAFDNLGFVVLEDAKYETFFKGFKSIYFSDLPVYISADSLLDALHLSFDRILMDLEENILFNSLDDMLRKMEEGLDGLEAQSEGADINQELDDVAVWVCVARSLLAGESVACKRCVWATAQMFLDRIDAEQIVEAPIFGVPIKEDYSQFKVRGHYTRTEKLQKYFRTMMWVQRIGFDFVHYPRHAVDAYLLTRLLHDNDAVEDFEVIDRTIQALVGVSDSLNAQAMEQLAAETDIQSAGDLKDEELFDSFTQAAIDSGAGVQQINSMILASNPTEAEGFTPIPPRFFMMGQRFIVDSYVFTNVVFDRVSNPDRYLPSPLDTWFVLGNRATVPLLEDEISYYNYQDKLAALEWIVSEYPEQFWSDNVYNLWLSSLKELDIDTTGADYPQVMHSRQWDHRMLNTQLASWAHLRHDTILYAKQSYSGEGCIYPDGFVDPYPGFFENLALLAENAIQKLEPLGIFQMMGEYDPQSDEEPFYGMNVRRFYEKLKEYSLLLADIARAELAGEYLTEAQVLFLNQLVYFGGGSGEPLYTGWYTELLYRYSDDNCETFDPTIADIHTDTNFQEVLHVGTGYANLMLLTIKNDCGTRAYIGPVLSYYERVEGDMNRLTDEVWKQSLQEGTEGYRPSWTESFLQ